MYSDKIETESPYGHITISYGRHDKHRVRVLDIDGGMESATYIEEELQNELLFEYMYLFDLMFDENYLENRQINDVLLIGGGAFHYPKYFLAHHQGNIDVVEINKVLYDISNKYFYLEETINKFDKNKNRSHYYFENGRDYINRNKKKYDAILSDVFIGENLVLELYSLEAIKRIKESLNPQGIYITNIIGSLSGKYSQNIKNVVKTLKQCFKYIYVFKAQEKNDHQKRQNLIVVAVDQEVHFNIISYHNINHKRYHQGMINHVDNLDLSNARVLFDEDIQ